ncbi:MAG: DegT/DnrJ/EryC1/StrS family aminotransferase [Acidobacteria bacterium]|nr:DegT/DnrJ/EryC1/StrS family aminotransferase [Acidobacteriota bacterium]MBV9145476.1 DegT/DnrJ/EryC1/StrS family aminotransferase [Acidobacteriota bacterium]MBV9437865.1 DegT/DnrJ/EryC1/StrS family aminotransferase [Acidobacteriota bacterium]
MEFVDLKAQYRTLEDEIQKRIAEVLASGRFIMGPQVIELEAALANRVRARHCISCSSGTDALLIVLMALGIRPGDEVITTPFTFIATAEMIVLTGAKPVFVDIDPRTYNLNPELLHLAITEKTRAIMPVALYGQCADMDAINSVAQAHGLPVIEDAAQSFGATYKGKFSCNLSTIGCTSFFPSKPLGCYGDGGACFTNDETLAAKMREIRDHGQAGRYHHVRVGINGRLDTLQAAILLAKLSVFDRELEQRRRVAKTYSDAFNGAVQVPFVEPYNTSAWAQYTVQVDNRPAIQQRLAAQNIPTAVHYPTPIHLQPALRDLHFGEGSLPVSEQAAKRVLSLPMHPYLTGAELREVSDALLQAIDELTVATTSPR